MIHRNHWHRVTVVFIMLLLIVGCGGQQAKNENQQPDDPPLSKNYQNLVVFDLTSTPEIKKDYSDEISQCQAGMVQELENKNSFQNVVRNKDNTDFADGSLLVKANVSEIRIVRGVARFFGGAFAGRSYMNVDVQLIDSETNTVVREKQINSKNNAWAAVWVSGASDHSLPTDVGKIIAGYIDAIVPN